jgi:molybdopterin-guanine dinucleotide biosynthesis protein A
MTSIVLAGGKSSRFGWNKVLETVNGKSLVQLVVDRLATISREIVLVTAREDCPSSSSLCPALKVAAPICPVLPAIRTVEDIYPRKGPLGGIYTGLVASSCLRAIVVGCDMPFVSVALLSYMSQLNQAFDAIVPRIGDLTEPLCAVYSKDCLAPIHSLLERNELGVRELFNIVRVRYIEEDEINRFDPQHLSFFNINTQADLDKARRLASGGNNGCHRS